MLTIFNLWHAFLNSINNYFNLYLKNIFQIHYTMPCSTPLTKTCLNSITKKAKLNFKNDFRTPFENRLKLHLQSLLDNIKKAV